MKDFDVYSYGVIASSTLHLLRQSFPDPDGYAEIAQSYSSTGGEALNSSIVLSRLGLKVFLDGNWIGDTTEGRDLRKTMLHFQLDTSRLRVKRGYSGVREIVFSDEHTRTNFGNYIDLLFTSRKWNLPHRSDVRRARIVCLDPFFGVESLQAGRFALEARIPYVTIDCSLDEELTAGAQAVIISGEFRRRQYPQADVRELFSGYQAHAGGLVIFTFGGEEILYGREEEPISRFHPYPVSVVDSAGAGDAFRAGVVYGFLHDWCDKKIIQFSAALAGLVCTSFPGVLKSPGRSAVEKFLRERDPSWTLTTNQ